MTMFSLARAMSPAFSRFERPKSRRGRSRGAHGVASFIAAVGLVAAAALIAYGIHGIPRPNPAPVASPVSSWMEIDRPLHLYALETPEFGPAPRLYEARQHRDGGGRGDVLTFGSDAFGKAPMLRLAIYRVGAEKASKARFFVDMARQAARAGLAVSRSAQPGDLSTRFGTFEVADMTLASSGVDAACLGFRLEASDSATRISGFTCGGGGKQIDRRTLACAIDRLELVAPGQDADLARFFAAAELARGNGCGAARASPPGAKPVELDSGARQPMSQQTRSTGKLSRR